MCVPRFVGISVNKMTAHLLELLNVQSCLAGVVLLPCWARMVLDGPQVLLVVLVLKPVVDLCVGSVCIVECEQTSSGGGQERVRCPSHLLVLRIPETDASRFLEVYEVFWKLL